jgi:hypothetical protein
MTSKILVIEDSAFLREFYIVLFEPLSNAEVFVAEDGDGLGDGPIRTAGRATFGCGVAGDRGFEVLKRLADAGLLWDIHAIINFKR